MVKNIFTSYLSAKVKRSISSSLVSSLSRLPVYKYSMNFSNKIKLESWSITFLLIASCIPELNALWNHVHLEATMAPCILITLVSFVSSSFTSRDISHKVLELYKHRASLAKRLLFADFDLKKSPNHTCFLING